MKKIININLSGRVIPIEDSAYESLQRYIESLRRYFAQEEGRDEIINDIESRIAELMNDKVRKGAAAVTDSDIDEIIHSMGRVEDFERAEAEDGGSSASSSTSAGRGMGNAQGFNRRQKGRMYRDTSDKLLGGVCSGIANYINVDPAIVRLLFAILTFGSFGMGVLLYILLWIVLPSRDLDSFVGKRFFRNPDDKVIGGVAGGIAAYFDKPSWVIRLIFVAPIIFNILFGTLDGLLFSFDRDIFPNLFIGSFSGMFTLIYIILWMVLPEAGSPFEKMEMRGEKVDVNRIRQNVKEEMENFKTRATVWSEEVKASAKDMGDRARDFANTRGKAFAGDVAQSARPVTTGLGHVLSVLVKAFFIFIFGALALFLFGVLMAIIFGGVAWWPINDYLWSSNSQKVLAWSTILLFLAVPIIGFMTWLIRRMMRARSKSRNLGWIFGGLWTIGWICAILFAISIAKDFRVYEKTEAISVPLQQPATGKLVVQVNEPPIRYSGHMWGFHEDNTGWDISSEEMRYNNVKVRIYKSEDSLFHVNLFKYSAGQGRADAQRRASEILFRAEMQDSTLNLASGITIEKESKFRMQGLIVEIHIPEGKRIRFDESLIRAYNPWVVRRSESGDYNRSWSRRYQIDWEYDEYFSWEANIDYVMGKDGKLVDPNRKTEEPGEENRITDPVPDARRDSIRRVIEERERQNEIDRRKLEEGTGIGKTKKIKSDRTREMAFISPFTALII